MKFINNVQVKLTWRREKKWNDKRNYNRKNPLENEIIQTVAPLNAPDLSLSLTSLQTK